MRAIICSKKVTYFLQFKSLQKNFSPKSIDAYRSDLIALEAYLKQTYHIRLEVAQLHHLDAYIAHLSDHQYKGTALNRKISTLRQFFKFLYLQGYIQENPARLLKSPKTQREAITPLNQAQIDRLIQATDEFPAPHNLRLKAIIELAFGAGLRVSELISLPLNAVTHNRDYTIITGKGNKERLIPLTPIMKQAIADFLPYRLFFSNGIDGPYLFLSTGRTGYLTRIRVFQLLKKLASYANIDPSLISPHIFRHSFAISLLRGGADLKSLQALLGHEKIDTVEIYTKINHEDLWNMLQQYHPLEKM